jgi:hypothetical protein
MVAQRLAGHAHRYDLGMRSRVVVADIAIPALAYRIASAVDQNRADRDLVVLALGARGEHKRVAHPMHIILFCVVGNLHTSPIEYLCAAFGASNNFSALLGLVWPGDDNRTIPTSHAGNRHARIWQVSLFTVTHSV